MSETLGPRNYGSGQEQMFLGREISRNEIHGEKITQLIDAEIDKILTEAHETAANILKDHRDRLELIAELLIDGSIDYWLQPTTHKVLDLCTGNGSLAVIAASVYPDVVVDAADISQDALDVARINVDRHGLQDRVALVHSDVLNNLPATYDLILCNPPYVNANSMAALPPEYHAEPALALSGNALGGTDGMDFIRQLLKDAPAHLSEKGVLVLEIGNEQAYFEAAFPGLEVVWLDTSAGEDQVLLITRAALIA